MYPHAAGKIASHGPYKQVADILSIPGLTEVSLHQISTNRCFRILFSFHLFPMISLSNMFHLLFQHDRAIMKKYKGELTVLPPGRMYKERINQRQST